MKPIAIAIVLVGLVGLLVAVRRASPPVQRLTTLEAITAGAAAASRGQ